MRKVMEYQNIRILANKSQIFLLYCGVANHLSISKSKFTIIKTFCFYNSFISFVSKVSLLKCVQIFRKDMRNKKGVKLKRPWLVVCMVFNDHHDLRDFLAAKSFIIRSSRKTKRASSLSKTF